MSTSAVARIDACVSKKSVYVLLVSMFLIALALPVWAGSKEKDEETLKSATNVLQQMLSDQNIPSDVIAKADCVIVLPNVKKFGFGIGGSGGRGPMVCRRNSGKWSAPAMYSIGGVSAGLQVGGSSSDYVLLVMNEKGVNAILNGKTELGKDATATAGPSGATAASVGGSDILTYKRAKGLFAGVSLGGASLEPDNDSNQRLYGKAISPQEIVQANAVPTPLAAQGMVSLLDSKYAKNN
jgi:lipid-binding SYLF domain-containing protein